MLHIIQMHNIYSIDYIIPCISKLKQKKNPKLCPSNYNQLKIHSKAFTQCFIAILFFKESLWEYLSSTSYFI